MTRRGIPGACLSIETFTSIHQRGLPPGGVRPHHGIEEEQDHEESQERQALIDSRFPISLWTDFTFFPSFPYSFPSSFFLFASSSLCCFRFVQIVIIKGDPSTRLLQEIDAYQVSMAFAVDQLID